MGMNRKAADMRIEERVTGLLSSDNNIHARGIKVRVSDGVVYLEGEVPDKNTKYLSGQLPNAVEGVKEVRNALEVVMPERNDIPPDEIIKESIIKLLREHFGGERNELDIEVSGGDVLIKGSVSSYIEKSDVDEMLSGLEGVNSVKNELTIAGSSKDDPLDRDIARRVEDLYENSYSIDAGKITVNVKQGIVMLSGEVAGRLEYDRAEETAKTADGVISVINDLVITGGPGKNRI